VFSLATTHFLFCNMPPMEKRLCYNTSPTATHILWRHVLCCNSSPTMIFLYSNTCPIIATQPYSCSNLHPVATQIPLLQHISCYNMPPIITSYHNTLLVQNASCYINLMLQCIFCYYVCLLQQQHSYKALP
jgi:hypothetical protein